MSQPVFNPDEEAAVSLPGDVTESDRHSAITAIDILYRDHHNWLFTWLRRKLNCQHQAADIAQDTFTRILALSNLPHLQEPRAYLVTTAKRLIINQSRKQQIEQLYLAALAQSAETTDGFPSPESIVSAIETLDKFSRILAGLAEKPRQAFLLHYLEGFTHAEIAAQLGVSDRMVRRYLMQTLVHCHQFDDPDGYDPVS
ncbi:sigma-70 family RNA polymerase sigma factor [Nitrosomonas europaea]|uniref:sigma-70 family RNA polymerase sigma factor n=1 Tax=Nitrosomonas europaea TaxID=915 RepID=UPI003266BE8A